MSEKVTIEVEVTIDQPSEVTHETEGTLAFLIERKLQEYEPVADVIAEVK